MPRPIDIAIVNGYVLPMGGAAEIPNGVVTILDDRISGVGPAGSIDLSNARKIIDATNCAVMPGFANSHTHVASNLLLRGLLEDVHLFEWLQTMWKLKKNFDFETLYWANMCGLVEMVKSGITSFNEHFDAYRVTPQIEALKQIPLRATLGYGFADRGLYSDVTDYSWRTLRNFGERAWPDLRVYFRSDGRERGAQQIALAPGEQRQVLFPHAFDTAGFHTLEVTADADALKKQGVWQGEKK